MFTKTQMAVSLGIVLGTASAALASTHPQNARHIVDSAPGARAMALPNQRLHSSNSAFDVYDADGSYVGSDPDPFIRNQLRRDPHGD